MLNAVVETVKKTWEGGEWLVRVKMHEGVPIITPILIDGAWHDAEVITPVVRYREAYRGRDEVRATAVAFSLKELERYNG